MIITPVAPTIKTQAPDLVTPYLLGAMDAEEGLAFAPEFYYAKDGDMAEYTEGFESVRGESEITRNFKNPLTDAQRAYEIGKRDHAENVYLPGGSGDFAGYLKGWNDAWALANGRTLVR